MVNIGYLLRLEDAVNANITPIQRDGRQAQRGKRCIMVFVQKPGNLVRNLARKSLQHSWYMRKFLAASPL